MISSIIVIWNGGQFLLKSIIVQQMNSLLAMKNVVLAT